MINNDNEMIAKATNLQPGDFIFELTVTDDKGDIATDSVTVSVVNNLRYEESITVYPNPMQARPTSLCAV